VIGTKTQYSSWYIVPTKCLVVALGRLNTWYTEFLSNDALFSTLCLRMQADVLPASFLFLLTLMLDKTSTCTLLVLNSHSNPFLTEYKKYYLLLTLLNSGFHAFTLSLIHPLGPKTFTKNHVLPSYRNHRESAPTMP
jgi:hypothetical protein